MSNAALKAKTDGNGTQLNKQLTQAKALLRRMRQTVEDIEDARTIERAKRANGHKPRIPWAQAKKDITVGLTCPLLRFSCCPLAPREARPPRAQQAKKIQPSHRPSIAQKMRCAHWTEQNGREAHSLLGKVRRADSIISQNFGFSCKASSSPVGRLER
jgi:hypothetical protein